MFQYGYCEDYKLKVLLKSVFNSSACFVPDLLHKSVFNGKTVDKFSKRVAVLSMPKLRALLYSIRNLFDFDVLKGQFVNPSHLLSKVDR